MSDSNAGPSSSRAVRNSEMCEAALDLAENGYHVFPCHPKRKDPATANGFKDATRDEAKILHFWDKTPAANIGVACGASGIVVVDVDPKYGADPSVVVPDLHLEYCHHTRTGAAPPPSPKYPNSLEGMLGAHVFLRGEHKTEHTRIDGVEIRSVGSYMIVPPSIHPSGVAYKGNLPHVSELQEWSGFVSSSEPFTEPLRAVLVPQVKAGQRQPVSTWLDMLDGIPEGSRHILLAKIIGHLLRRYIHPDLVHALARLINEHSCAVPLEEDDLDHIVEMICNAETRRRAGRAA
jgi:hypothetical protein